MSFGCANAGVATPDSPSEYRILKVKFYGKSGWDVYSSLLYYVGVSYIDVK